MCGILAQVGTTVDEAVFREALASLHHRGPDGSGVWIDSQGGTALGHTRLAFVGGENAAQPLQNEDGTIVATVNGEFYDLDPLRHTLEQRGHHFSTGSDSEVAIHAYESFGLDFLTQLRGEFALVLWDRPRRRLIAARDRFGIKPLVYAHQGKRLALASESKALFRLGVAPSWDPESLAAIFTHQYLPPCSTLFHGVRQLPPAHALIHERDNLELHRYWAPGVPDNLAATPEEIRDLLDESIRLRLRDSEPVAFSLSAGLDSSAVVSLASRATGNPVDAFTISFDDEAYDELPAARANAQEIGCQIHPVPISRGELLEAFEPAIVSSEGTAINAQLSAKFILCAALKASGFKAVLSGEGADEVFLGYAHLQLDAFPDSLPSSHSNLQAGVMLPDQAAKLPSPPAWLGAWPSFLAAKTNLARRCDPFLAAEFKATLDRPSRLLQTLEEVQRLDALDARLPLPLKSAWLWTRLALANYILKTLGDGMEMANSLEGRLPFLDHHLFERAWRAPLGSKLTATSTKQLLREALARDLPPAITQRVKQPLLAPTFLGSTDPALLVRLREFLCPRLLADLPFIDGPAAEKWFDRLLALPPSDRKRHDPALCLLLSCLFLQKTYSPSKW